MTDDKHRKGSCLVLAAGLYRFDPNGNKINLSPVEIVEAATKFYNFINSAEQKEPKNG